LVDKTPVFNFVQLTMNGQEAGVVLVPQDV